MKSGKFASSVVGKDFEVAPADVIIDTPMPKSIDYDNVEQNTLDKDIQKMRINLEIQHSHKRKEEQRKKEFNKVLSGG